jgi:AcrR family transcriptional regulator
MATSRTRLSRADRRGQLLDIARGVFASRGFEATALEEIAEAAGVSRPIIYNHFGDKSGLFQAVVAREIEQVQALVSQAISAPGKPRDLIEQGLRAFFTYVREQPEGHGVLTRDAPLHLSTSGVAGMLDGLAARVTEVVAEAMATLGADPAPAPIYAHALIGLGAHVGRWWQDHPDYSLEDVTEYSTAMVWSGFGGLISEKTAKPAARRKRP